MEAPRLAWCEKNRHEMLLAANEDTKLHQIAKKGTQIRCDREFSNDAIVFAVNTLRLISQSPAHTALRLQLKINGNTTMMNHESPPTATFKGYKMIKNMSLIHSIKPTNIFQTTRCEKLVKKSAVKSGYCKLVSFAAVESVRQFLGILAIFLPRGSIFIGFTCRNTPTLWTRNQTSIKSHPMIFPTYFCFKN